MSIEQTDLEQSTPLKGRESPLLEPNIVNNECEELLRKNESFGLALGLSDFEEGLYIKDENESPIPIESEEHFEEAFLNFKAFYKKK